MMKLSGFTCDICEEFCPGESRIMAFNFDGRLNGDNDWDVLSLCDSCADATEKFWNARRNGYRNAKKR